ncbi:MAG: transposase [Bacteroidales bacterium]|nr:transposase [Bacteroidales bacterium]
MSKFVDHLPFYRQVQIFNRQQLTIPESTIGGWFKQVADYLNYYTIHLKAGWLPPII